MKKIDIILALITGEVVAWFFYGILKNLGIEIRFLALILAISLPIFALAGLWVSFLLGKKILWIFQVAKFLLIGVLATLLDLGILNLLMWVSGIASGVFFSVFKSISFIIATISKYWGNKFWAFEKAEMAGVGKEFGQFFLVTLVGFGLNVGIASFIVNAICPPLGMNPVIWANIGAIIAALVAAIWNFLGYKFIVFKK